MQFPGRRPVRDRLTCDYRLVQVFGNVKTYVKLNRFGSFKLVDFGDVFAPGDSLFSHLSAPVRVGLLRGDNVRY